MYLHKYLTTFLDIYLFITQKECNNIDTNKSVSKNGVKLSPPPSRNDPISINFTSLFVTHETK